MNSIKIQNLTKRFQIGYSKRQTALGRLIRTISGREPKRRITVLENISFDVRKGERLGVIGSNGAGKSTLLRCIAGIYSRYDGAIITKGRVVPVINLYWSLQDRLSMRDNIYLCCALLGMSRSEINRSFLSICLFSDLKKYTQTKVYQFSTGMKQRLAFSMAIHAKPDILLIDEVFEVGDEHFKKKCFSTLQDLASKEVTILIISSDLGIIQKNCDKVIWLEKSKVRMYTNTSTVVNEYLKNGK